MWHCQLIISAFRVVQTCSWISESCSENFQVQDKRCNKRIAQHYYRKPPSWTNKTTERRISNKLHVTSARSWNTRAQVRCKCNAKVTAIIRFTDQTDNLRARLAQQTTESLALWKEGRRHNKAARDAARSNQAHPPTPAQLSVAQKSFRQESKIICLIGTDNGAPHWLCSRLLSTCTPAILFRETRKHEKVVSLTRH